MKYNNLKVYIILICIVLVAGIYVLVNRSIKVAYTPNYNLEDFYVLPKTKVEANEYKVINISEKDMVSTYFNIYMSMCMDDVNEAYNRLNQEFRDSHLETIELFIEHIKKITLEYTIMPKIKEYNISHEKNKTIYTIIDENDNIYVFVVEAVMKYEVYFDSNNINLE